MITQEDLNWWLQTARTVEWIWAKTYADTAPHDYIVEGRTSGLSHDDYVRAARVIHTFGQPGKFYSVTNIYLEDRETGVKWWTMDADVAETTLVNRSTTSRLYGVQNAPSTRSSISTPYDGIATTYDAANLMPEPLVEQLRRAVRNASGKYAPSILDVGCGTGRVLDLELTSPDRYAGVDPSTPMLNQLVRKHPDVARVYPCAIEDALDQELFTSRQFEIVILMLDQEDLVRHDVIDDLRQLASRAFIYAVDGRLEVHGTERIRPMVGGV